MERSNSTLCTTSSEIKRSLLKDVMRRILATGYRHFETVYRPLFKCQAVLRPLKKRSVFSSETSANTFLRNPHNTLEERSPHIRRRKPANSRKIHRCLSTCCVSYFLKSNRNYL